MIILTAVAILQTAIADSMDPNALLAFVSGPIDEHAMRDDAGADKGSDQGLYATSFRVSSAAAESVRGTNIRAFNLVKRNRLVRIEFTKGALTMSAEGRALSNGAEGDLVRVLNIRSRIVVTGVVVGADRVAVQ